jgi:hypothetical protein
MEVKWTRHRPFIRFAVDSSAGIEMRYFEKMDETSVTLKFTVVQTSHLESKTVDFLAVVFFQSLL